MATVWLPGLALLPALQLGHQRRLVAGQHLSHDLARFGVEAQAAAHGVCCTPVVARDHHHMDASRAQRCQGF
jgi:hypothetical protein